MDVAEPLSKHLKAARAAVVVVAAAAVRATSNSDGDKDINNSCKSWYFSDLIVLVLF